MTPPAQTAPEHTQEKENPAKHEPKGKLSGQCGGGGFLQPTQKRAALSAKIPVPGALQAKTGWLLGLLQ